MRRFWRGEPGHLAELASRLSGSSDIFQASGRRTYASVNFVTAHDGFTLADLTSYERKHNRANGEGNRDGSDENLSSNWGHEGPSADEGIAALRARTRRNLLATLLVSQGVRMLLAGDELGRTQRGNNNAYCQDNEVSWVDWRLGPESRDLLEFTRSLTAVFRANPVLRHRSFFTGRPGAGGVPDVTWLRAAGGPMEDAEWGDPDGHVLGMLLHGRGTDEVDERGRPTFGDTLLVLLNGGAEGCRFALPDGPWEAILDTAGNGPGNRSRGSAELAARSLLVLRQSGSNGAGETGSGLLEIIHVEGAAERAAPTIT
jgi:glycogen operon protein